MTETEKEKCKHTIVSLGITEDDADYFLHLFQITFKFKIPVLLRAFLLITSLTGIVFGYFINEEFYSHVLWLKPPASAGKDFSPCSNI